MITPEALPPLEIITFAPLLITLFHVHKAHIIPKYRGGTNDESNVVPGLPVPLHAFQHLLVKESLPKGHDQDANSWAVSKLVQSMNNEERAEFNRLLALHEKDRREGNW